MSKQTSSENPAKQASQIKEMLDDIISHVRKDIESIDEPRAQVLFETTTEVLTGLKTAYEHYELGTETAFRR